MSRPSPEDEHSAFHVPEYLLYYFSQVKHNESKNHLVWQIDRSQSLLYFVPQENWHWATNFKYNYNTTSFPNSNSAIEFEANFCLWRFWSQLMMKNARLWFEKASSQKATCAASYWNVSLRRCWRNPIKCPINKVYWCNIRLLGHVHHSLATRLSLDQWLLLSGSRKAMKCLYLKVEWKIFAWGGYISWGKSFCVAFAVKKE